MTEPTNGTVKPLQLAPQDAFAYLYFDLAIAQLDGMSNQLGIIGKESVAQIFKRMAEKMIEKRNGFVRQCQTGIEIVGADALPPDPRPQ